MILAKMLFTYLLPWATGTAVWLLFAGRPQRGYEWANAVGYGFLTGILITSVLAGIVMLVLADSSRFLVGLGLVIALGLATAYQWGRPRPAPIVSARAPQGLYKWLWWLLLAWLIARCGQLVAEAFARPIYPWDAWSAWAVKGKMWFGLREMVGYVPYEAWLTQPGGDLYTAQAWGYPPLIPLWQMWVALGIGDWHEPIINLTWPACGIALLLAFYGQLRALGQAPMNAMVATWALGTLPILNSHIALAGYADLLVATGHGLATLALLRFAVTRESNQFWAAVLLAVGLMYIKLEGAVWLLTLAPALVVARLSARGRLIFMSLGAIVLAVVLVIDDLSLWVPTLGTITLEPGLLTVPRIGEFTLGFRDSTQAVLRVLFEGPNWHLLWYVVVGALLVRWRQLVYGPALASGFLIVACGSLFLFFLFFYTDASQWADNYTSTNRLVLHFAPAVIAYVTLLLGYRSRAGNESEDLTTDQRSPNSRPN